jgi:hypothetical protein
LTLGSNSANGTSMASRTRVGLRVSTVLFTDVLLDGVDHDGAAQNNAEAPDRV